MKSIKIESGEFCILIKGNNDQVIKSIRKDFHHFSSKRKEDFIIELKIYDRSTIVQNKFGKIDLKKKIGKIPMRGYDKEHFLFILRSIFSAICSKNNSILLHSAGVVNKNKAYVFCGPPHAGKSTVSMLSHDCKLLSDDYIIIKKTSNKFKVYGTSLGGEYINFGKVLKPNNISAKIDKIFFIKQSKEHRVEKKSFSEATQELLNEVFFYRDNSKESKELVRKNFNTIHNLCNSVGCYNLYFQKNDGFWEEIKQIE